MISIIFVADVFSQSDTAKTMAEITRIDPQFNKDSFLKECEFEIIPAVLEVRSCLSLTALILLFIGTSMSTRLNCSSTVYTAL